MNEMDTEKINDLMNKIKLNRVKMNMEKDLEKKEELRKKIMIDELKIKIERLK
jgi:hypothetical protein